MHMYVYCSTIHNSKDLEPTQNPISDRLEKENVAHIHHGNVCSHEKGEFMSFAGTWMKLEIIILGRGRWGGIAWGEMPNVGEGEKGSKTRCHVCTYATVLHVLLMYPKT